MTTTKPTVTFSRPIDKSLAGYKAWMLRVLARLGGTDDMTDEQWETEWREFWGDEAQEVQP